MKQTDYEGPDLGKVVGEQAEDITNDAADQRRVYRNSVLGFVVAFFAGTIVRTLYNMLGFGGFLFAALLLLLGGLLVYFFYRG